MSHHEARMSSKGQVTIPAAVLEFFKLKEGDIVDFYVDDRIGVVRVLARNWKFEDSFALGEKYATPGAAVEDYDDAIGDHLAAEDERIIRQWNELMEFRAWKKARQQKAAE